MHVSHCTHVQPMLHLLTTVTVPVKSHILIAGALNKVANLPGGAEVVQQAPQQQQDSAVRLQ